MKGSKIVVFHGCLNFFADSSKQSQLLLKEKDDLSSAPAAGKYHEIVQ